MNRTILLPFTLIIFVSSIQAQNINTPENFPDPNFRAVVEEYMGVEVGGEFSATDAAGKTEWFDCSGKEIANLKGIEYFERIGGLICSNNNLTEIDVTNNTALTYLDFLTNEIQVIDVSMLTNLGVLKCGFNPLIQIDISQNSNLFELDCRYTNITEIDLSMNSKLKTAILNSNEIIDIDFSNNPLVEFVWLNNNRLTGIHPSILNLENLRVLNFRNNNLDCDDWDSIQQLRSKLGDTTEQRNIDILDGFAFSPQNGFNPFACDQNYGLVFNPKNGHYYSVFHTPLLWDEAKAWAETVYDSKGYLATITSQAESDFILYALGEENIRGLWLGGYQDPSIPEDNPESYGIGWQWITGESWEYTNWNESEPNQSGEEDYLEITHLEGAEATWNDQGSNQGSIASNFVRGYLVEWNENPLPEVVILPTLIVENLPHREFQIPNLQASSKPLDMVLMPSGTFVMGSPNNEQDRDDVGYDGNFEGPLHSVTISKPFFIGKYEVTQAQWQSVMGNNPSRYTGDSDHPVEQISWNDTQTFLQKLNALGLGTFRLPTEAEWEYAARAGTGTRFYWGDDQHYQYVDAFAWYQDNNDEHGTKEVGLKLPNQWGLFDMSGNVWEWCQDWAASYTSAPQTDPTGPDSAIGKIHRGGAFHVAPQALRSAIRFQQTPDSKFDVLGFRLVREYDPQTDSFNINTVENFPDPNFRAAVEEFMGVATGGIFTLEEAAGKTGKLICSNRNISNMKGLEYFTGIIELDCSDNPLIDIDVSQNTALQYFECRRSQLQDLDVSNNAGLILLACPANSISTLDLSNNKHLQILDCGWNNLKSLDISNNQSLTQLWLIGNNVSELDLSNNNLLEYLKLNENQFSTIDFSNNPNLTYIDVSDNFLEEIDLSKNPALTIIGISRNNLKRIDLSWNQSLSLIECNENQIEEIILPNPSNLTRVVAFDNRLTSISEFQSISTLQGLDVRNNLLDCGDIEDIQILSVQFPDEAILEAGWSIQQGFLYEPQSISIDSCFQNINTRRNFVDSNLRAAIEEFMGVAPGGSFTGLDAAQKTGVLDLSGRGIGRLSGTSDNGLNYFINVDTILLNDNELTDVSLLLTNDWAKPGRVLDVRNNRLENDFLIDLELFRERLQGNIEYLPQQKGNGILHAVFSPENQHYYALFDRRITWHEAKVFAESLFNDGYLCTVTSPNENNILIKMYGTKLHGKFMGGYQSPDINETLPENYGVGWNWITGEEWDYENWGEDNPDDWKEFTLNGEDYLNFIGEQGTVGTWNDTDHINEYGFIVEWNRKPSSNIVVINPEDLPSSPLIGGNTIQGQPGSEIVVSIPGTNLPDISSFSFDLSYDPSLLSYQSINKENTLTESWSFVDANEVESGKLIIAGLGNSPIENDGTLVDLHFTIAETANSGTESTIEISNVVGIDDVITETITIVIGVSLGDLNDDGTVNILDVQILFDAVLGRVQLSSAQTAAGDLDNNEIVNILDVQRLFNVVLGRESLPAKTVLNRITTSQTNQITIDSISVNPGDLVQLPLRVSGNSTISAIEGTVVYDNSKLEYTGFDTVRSITEGFSLIDVFEVSPGQLNFAGINGNAVDGNGILFHLSFAAKAGANGDTVVRFEKVGGDLEGYTVLDGIVNIGIETDIGRWMLY